MLESGNAEKLEGGRVASEKGKTVYREGAKVAEGRKGGEGFWRDRNAEEGRSGREEGEG